MKIIMEAWRGFLDEEIHPYTNTATVFHAFGKGSTGAYVVSKEDLLDIVKVIQKDGFIPGAGNLYGEGVYTVYDLVSLRSIYGNYALIFEVTNLDKFLIFDYKEAKKVYGKNHRMMDQLKKNGIQIDEEIERLAKLVDQKNRGFKNITSELAQKLRSIDEVRKKIRGIVFYGQRDGEVLVGYYPEDFTLIGYGEKFPAKRSSWGEFVLQGREQFAQKMMSFYKLKDERIDKQKFLEELSDLFLLNARDTIDGSKLMELTRDSYFQKNVLTEEAFDQLLGPEIAAARKELEDIYFSNDEEDEKRAEELYFKVSDKEQEALEEAYSIYKKELNRFFDKGYFKGMLRKFKLNDDLFKVNIKKLPKG